MADLRLMAFSCWLAGCSAAGAQPATSSGITPPAGWQPLPAVAAATKLAAAAPGVTVDGVEAWGEPAMGCYGLWISLHGGSAGTDQLANDMLDGFVVEKITAVAEPGDGQFTIEKAPYKGRLHARMFDGQITAVACVANQREPVACEAACKQLLGALR